MSEQAPGIRIVTMQQDVIGHNATIKEGVERQQYNVLMEETAQRALAQAYADGYEIAGVTVSVGERVIATVWTLKPAERVTMVPFTLPLDRPAPSFDTVR